MPTTIKLKNGSGAPTAGQLVQAEPAFDLTNKRLYTEDSGGTVIEIGTSPSTIDINAGTVDGISSLSTANGTDVSFAGVSGTKFFWDASAESLGIGTSSPAGLLELNGGGYATSGGTLIVRQKGDTNTDGIALTSSNVTSHRIWKDANGYLNIGSSAAPSAFVQDIAGNVGIGTSSPTAKLEIRNDVTASTDLDPTAIKLFNNLDGGSAIEFSNGVAGKSKISFGVEATGSGTDDTYIGFSTSLNAGALTERMRLDSSGNLLMSSDGTSGEIRVGNSSSHGAVLRPHSVAAATNTPSCLNFYGESTGTLNCLEFRYGVGASATIVGTVTRSTTATAYNTSSDYRLKENVVPMDNASSRVLALKPCRFNFIADPNKTVDGFLAHEAQAVVPEAVHGVKDEVDDEGNPVYQGIDQSKLVPLLTKALQEALTEIESLKARLDAAGL